MSAGNGFQRNALELIARYRSMAPRLTDELALAEADRALLKGLIATQQNPQFTTEPPDVERAGLGYKAIYWRVGVEMRLERIRESRGEVHGELTVVLCDGLTVFDRHLYQARFNLSSVSARTTAAKYLDGRMPHSDWTGMLERFCMAVLSLERQGQEFEAVGQRPTAEEERWLLRPLLLRGKSTVLFGAGGSWKSTLGAAVAVGVTCGVEVIEKWEARGESNVLILDWEDGADTWNQRVRHIATGAGQSPPEVHYRSMSKPLCDELEPLASFVNAKKIDLLIVDSVGLAVGASSEQESVADGAFRLFAALRELGTTNLLIDHVAGAELGQAGPTSKPYGSIYKVNLARSVFEVRKPKEVNGDRAELILVQTKTNGIRVPPMELAIVHGEGTITFERGQVKSADLSKMLPLVERMTRELQVHGSLPYKELADSLDEKQPALRQACRRNPERFQVVDGRISLSAGKLV